MTAPQDPFAAPDPDAPPVQPTSPGPAPYGQPGGFGAPPAYGQAPYGTPVAPARNGLGTAALVLGILAVVGVITIFGAILLGILAIVLGIVARGRVKRGEASNGGSATAGIVLGAVGLALALGLIAFGVSILNSDSGKEFQDCVENAAGDRSAIEACQREFQEGVTG